MSSALPAGREGARGAEDGRETGKTSGERGRERGRRNGVLPPVRHTHASQRKSSRGEDRKSIPPSYSRGKTRLPLLFCFVVVCGFFFKLLKPNKEKTCIIKTQSKQTYRGDWLRSEQRRELGAKSRRSAFSAPRTADMAPIVEEGAQLGESKLFFTSSRTGTRCDGVCVAHDSC